MTPRLSACTVLFAAAATALFVSAPAQSAPPAPASPGQNCAAGYMADPNSNSCWQMAGSGAPTIGGGPCMPGRIGTCLGYLSNNPIAPGSTITNNTWP